MQNAGITFITQEFSPERGGAAHTAPVMTHILFFYKGGDIRWLEGGKEGGR